MDREEYYKRTIRRNAEARWQVQIVLIQLVFQEWYSCHIDPDEATRLLMLAGCCHRDASNRVRTWQKNLDLKERTWNQN